MADDAGRDRLRRFLAEDTDDVEILPDEPARGKIGKYLIRREIGRGGMAVVYEAEDPELKRRVALKILKETTAAPAVLQRFHREAAIAAQLQHANIVAIHEVGMTKDEGGRATHFIAMDLVEGRTLADAFRDPNVSRDEKLRMLEEVSRAVAYAHSKGVVHRDLKPGNVLVEKSGRALLTDFGLAHAGAFQTKLTQSNAVMGTPHYMAPEQVSGRTQDVDSRTDVYALGVILYELMAGRPPFEADTPAGVYYRILEQEPPRPSRITGRADADLELICLKAMSKDSAQRYPDALAFADDLHRYRNGEPVHARPPSVVYRLRKAVGRRRGILITAGIGVVAMIGAILVTRHAQYTSARDEATRAFAAKDWRAARDACRRALGLRSDDALALLQTECETRLKAETEEQRRRLDDAEDYRRLKERLGPIESAIKETRPWFYARGVDIREKLRKIETALEELSELARIPANDRQPELWSLVGIGRYFLGDHTRAEEALVRSIERGSKDGWVHYYLGRIYLDRSMAARLVVNAALEEDNPPARELSLKAGREMARSLEAGVGAEEVDRVIVEAYRLMAEGNDPAALDKCEEGLKKFGGAMGAEEFWNLRGWLWGNDRERQEYAFTQAIERRPHDAFAHFMRSISRVMQGRTDEALDDLDKAIEVNPYLIPAYNNRGHLKIKRGDANGALADFNAGLRLSPNEPGLLCNRGKILITIGDVKGALRDYNEAVRVAPQFYLSWLQRGVVHYGMGEFQKAFDDYTQAMKLNPRAPEPYVDRGNIFRRWRKFDEAIADYEKALEVTPPRWEHRALVEKLLQQAKDGIED